MAYWFVTYNDQTGIIHTCEEREGSFDLSSLRAEFDTSGAPDWTPSYEPLEIDETTYNNVHPDPSQYKVDFGDDETLPSVVSV